MSSLPRARNKEAGEERGGSEPKASGGSWCTCQRGESAPPDLSEQARAGTAPRQGRGDTLGDRRGGREKGTGTPSPATHIQHPSVRSSWCLLSRAAGKLPGKGWLIFDYKY